MKRSILGLLLLSGVLLANDFSRDDTNNVVIDNATNLMWQDDVNTTKTWSEAITYCEDLSLASHEDWRLPNQNELESIVDDTTYNPAIDSTFHNVVSSDYWSSTTDVAGSSDAWGVDFDGGYAYADNKANTYYVRCVRDN
jgi:hypothetical protein